MMETWSYEELLPSLYILNLSMTGNSASNHFLHLDAPRPPRMSELITVESGVLDPEE